MSEAHEDREAALPLLGWAVTSRAAAVCAALALLVGALLPPEGLDLALCWFNDLTGLPCPGCGLTRAVTSTVQLRPLAAVGYHPFGPALVLLALASIGGAAFGGERLRRALERRRRLLALTFRLALAAFVLFGLVRVVAVGCGLVDWPP